VSAISNNRWYLSRDGRRFGPITADKLRGLVQAGQVKQDDYLWCPDFTEWIRFGSISNPVVTPPSHSRFRFLHSLNRFLRRRVLAEPTSILKKIGQIVSRPSEFANEVIKDDKPKAIFDSVKFYVKVFAVAFAFFAIADKFNFYQHVSEIRFLLIRLMPQLAVGSLIVFFLLPITRNRVPFGALLQIILYVDAVYLLFDALVTIPFGYLNYVLHAPAASKEIDLFATEFEKCLSTDSVAYWLIRGGDLQYFMYDDSRDSWAQVFLQYRRYITAIPFLFLFAQMVRRKYGSNFWVAVIAAGVAFVTANESFDWAERRAGTALASKTNCESKYVQALVQKYSAQRIAKQLEFRLSNSFKQSYPKVSHTFWLDGNEYTIAFKVADTVTHTNSAALWGSASQFSRSLYCSHHPYWIAIRGMGYSLSALVLDQEKTVVSLRLKPSDCDTASASTTFSASPPSTVAIAR
jgi:hypothetical protein